MPHPAPPPHISWERGPWWWNLSGYIAAKAWNQLNLVSIDKIFLDLYTGSRQREENDPFSELDIVTSYLLLTFGLGNNTPNSMNSLFHILERSLSDAQASMGGVGLEKNCVGRTGFMTGSSCDKADCVAGSDPSRIVSPNFEDDTRGEPGNWWMDTLMSW